MGRAPQAGRGAQAAVMIRRGWRLAALVALMGAAAADSSRATGEAALPPTGISYTIEGRLDPAARSFSGREEIRWTNPTDEALPTLPLHLYLNAFSHTGTTWLREEDISRFELTAESLLKIDDDPWGWIEPRAIRQRGAAGGQEREATWHPVQPDDGNPLDRTLAEVSLPEPVAPRGQTVLVIEFEGRLPVPMARTGGRLDFFLLAQW